jgi:hypothetical protein
MSKKHKMTRQGVRDLNSIPQEKKSKGVKMEMPPEEAFTGDYMREKRQPYTPYRKVSGTVAHTTTGD